MTTMTAFPDDQPDNQPDVDMVDAVEPDYLAEPGEEFEEVEDEVSGALVLRPKRQPVTLTRPSLIIARERQAKALELRKKGRSYREIAAECGYSDQSAASKAVKAAMDRITVEDAVDLRKITDERLNSMMVALWTKVEEGDVKAIEAAVKVQDRLMRLHGLDAAKKIEVTNQTDVRHVSVQVDSDFLAGLKAAAGHADAPNVIAPNVQQIVTGELPVSGGDVVQGEIVLPEGVRGFA